MKLFKEKDTEALEPTPIIEVEVKPIIVEAKPTIVEATAVEIAPVEVTPLTAPISKPTPRAKAEVADFEKDFTATPAKRYSTHSLKDTRGREVEIEQGELQRYSVSYVDRDGRLIQFTVAGTIEGIKAMYGREVSIVDGKDCMQYRYVGKLNGYERCYYE